MLVGQGADKGDGPGPVFDGVDAGGGHRGVRGHSGHAHGVQLAALVCRDRAHAGRLADHAAECLHVGGAAAVQSAVAYFRRERVAGPGLAIHRYDVGVAGEHDASGNGAIMGGKGTEEVGLGAVRIGNKNGLQAQAGQLCRHCFDQFHDENAQPFKVTYKGTPRIFHRKDALEPLRPQVGIPEP